MAHEARLEFSRNIARGESCIDLALAALQIAAEDDAMSKGLTTRQCQEEPFETQNAR